LTFPKPGLTIQQLILKATLTAVIIASAPVLIAQEMEPRAYSNVPIGMNFAVVGYGYTDGKILLDASVPLEDAEISSHAVVLAYSRSLNFFGDSAKFDVVIPYGWASGSATFAGQPFQRDVNGFGDPAVRFTWNFFGAPALTLPEFRDHQSDWIVGASLRIGMPLGQYDADKLLNLGLNRWSFKPELGVSRAWRRWTFELATGVTFYTDNDDFLDRFTREQDPLIAVQGHAIYNLPRGIWLGVNGTFYTGGRTTLNGTVNDDRQSNARIGVTLSVPLTRQQSLKLHASTGVISRSGGDFQAAGIAWQYRWGGKMPPDSPVP